MGDKKVISFAIFASWRQWLKMHFSLWCKSLIAPLVGRVVAGVVWKFASQEMEGCWKEDGLWAGCPDWHAVGCAGQW